jgi:positive regulator of sigma E activity
LLAALAGAVALGLVLPGGEPGALAGAALGLLFGLRWARTYGERHGADATLQPVVLGLSDGDGCAGGNT